MPTRSVLSKILANMSRKQWLDLGQPVSDELREELKTSRAISDELIDRDIRYVPPHVFNQNPQHQLPELMQWGILAKHGRVTAEDEKGGLLIVSDVGDGTFTGVYRPHSKDVEAKYRSVRPDSSGVFLVKKGSPTSDIVIVEGQFQSRAYASNLAPDTDVTILGIPGCRNWMSTGDAPSLLLASAKGRGVSLLFDADARNNPSVAAAREELAAYLYNNVEAGKVTLLELPEDFTSVASKNAKGVCTAGLDDYLATFSQPERSRALSNIPCVGEIMDTHTPHGNSDEELDTALDGDVIVIDGNAKTFKLNPRRYRGGKLTGVKLVNSIVDYLLRNYALCVDKGDNLYVFKPEQGRFVNIEKGFIEFIREKVTQNRTSVRQCSEIKTILKANRYYREQFIKEAPAKGVIPFLNGAYNLREKKFYPYKDYPYVIVDYQITSVIPHCYDPEVKTEKVYNRLKAIFNKKAMVNGREQYIDNMPYLLKFLSTALDFGSPTRMFLLMWGESHTGKSETNRILEWLIGSDNSVSGDFDSLNRDNHALSKIYRKSLILFDELPPSNKINNITMLKMLTGGAPLHCNPKNKDAFDFYNYGFISICANELPQATGEKTQALNNRIVPFNPVNVFKTKTNTPPSELFTEEDASGFINAIIAAYNPDEVLSVENCTSPYERALYLSSSNPMAKFWDTHLAVSPNRRYSERCITKTQLREHFINFLKDEGVRLTPGEIKSKIEELITEQDIVPCRPSRAVYGDAANTTYLSLEFYEEGDKPQAEELELELELNTPDVEPPQSHTPTPSPTVEELGSLPFIEKKIITPQHARNFTIRGSRLNPHSIYEDGSS